MLLYERNEPTSLGMRPHQYATYLGDGDQEVPDLEDGKGTGTNVGMPKKPRHRRYMNTDVEGSPNKTRDGKKGSWSNTKHRPQPTTVGAPEDAGIDILDDDGDILENYSGS